MDTLSMREIKRPESRRYTRLRWKQLASLAALYASITIGWIAYQNYQPQLLVRFQFLDFAFALAVAQAVILVVTPLVAGRMGDRYRLKSGHRLPIIASGISIAAMVFMAVAFTLLTNPGELFRWVLPVLIILWLISMSVFTSPALSTLELFAPVDKLPYAAALLTITGNIVYSLEPIIVDLINLAGAPATFAAGGVAVSVSGYALKRNSLSLFRESGDREPGIAQKAGPSPYRFIFLLGLATGLIVAVLFYWVPGVFTAVRGGDPDDGRVFVSGMLLVSALLSWPLGHTVNRYGTQTTLRACLLILMVTIAVARFAASPLTLVLAALFFTAAMTGVSIAALPMVIHRAAPSEKVFAVGVFFSGAALPEGLWEAWLAQG